MAKIKKGNAGLNAIVEVSDPVSQIKLMEEIRDLVEDLGWEYQRMSTSGKITYRELCLKLGWEFEWEDGE
jgi:hypothetical protein|tara:strand:- start:334 stop:543 length:210 start_codon:yes stop_codon:yes gene_type:complete